MSITPVDIAPAPTPVVLPPAITPPTLVQKVQAFAAAIAALPPPPAPPPVVAFTVPYPGTPIAAARPNPILSSLTVPTLLTTAILPAPQAALVGIYKTLSLSERKKLQALAVPGIINLVTQYNAADPDNVAVFAAVPATILTHLAQAIAQFPDINGPWV